MKFKFNKKNLKIIIPVVAGILVLAGAITAVVCISGKKEDPMVADEHNMKNLTEATELWKNEFNAYYDYYIVDEKPEAKPDINESRVEKTVKDMGYEKDLKNKDDLIDYNVNYLDGLTRLPIGNTEEEIQVRFNAIIKNYCKDFKISSEEHTLYFSQDYSKFIYATKTATTDDLNTATESEKTIESIGFNKWYDILNNGKVATKTNKIEVLALGDGGEVTGSGDYKTGESVTVTAKQTGNVNSFHGWYIDDKQVSENLEYTFTVEKDVTIYARFSTAFYDISLSCYGGEVEGSGSYKYEEDVTVKATSTVSDKFIGWYDGDTLLSDKQEYSFKVTKNITLTAKFEVKGYEVKCTGEHCKIYGTGTYEPGSHIEVIVVPDKGYKLNGLYNEKGKKVTDKNVYPLDVNNNESFTAMIELDPNA